MGALLIVQLQEAIEQELLRQVKELNADNTSIVSILTDLYSTVLNHRD